MEMELAKLTSKGQLTLPVAIRKKLCLEEGGKVVFLMDGDDIRIMNASRVTMQGVAGKGNMENSTGNAQEDAPKSKRQSIPGQKR